MQAEPMTSSHTPSIDADRHRFPYCIVWTPIPVLTWLFPFIGHMGIANSRGIIRDFAGPYFVSEDAMGFGWPTRFWVLQESDVVGGSDNYDRAIREASDVYKGRMHNLCCDNCHSHVALALNTMQYRGSTSWNMVNLCFFMLIKGRFVSLSGFLKQFLPTAIILSIVLAFVFWLQ
ncbi:unnamed protein product, partial [Mesorhabditis spiculigera]